MSKNDCHRTLTVTHAGEWVSYYDKHPDELPERAPNPACQPAEFAEWVNHNLPEIIKKVRIS